jgi:hypothetical protein
VGARGRRGGRRGEEDARGLGLQRRRRRRARGRRLHRRQVNGGALRGLHLGRFGGRDLLWSGRETRQEHLLRCGWLLLLLLLLELVALWGGRGRNGEKVLEEMEGLDLELEAVKRRSKRRG